VALPGARFRFLLSSPTTPNPGELLDAPKPTTAIVGSLYVGTNRLGRALTNAESKALAILLRAHDFIGASIISLRFAFRLRRNQAAAQDLQGRANLRLVRQGWDWKVVTLVKALCRFVWSEHTNEKSETARTRKAEEVFLTEQGIHSGTATPSAEVLALRIETERREDERDTAQLQSLRAAFTEAKDEVNLLWLKYSLEKISDATEMARLSGRDVDEFYVAAKRRKRHVLRLAAAASGVKYEEDT
jgi:hypothetical protein